MEFKIDDLARTAYTVYAEAVGGKNVRGEPMPEFDHLPPLIRNAWCAAMRAVILETSYS